MSKGLIEDVKKGKKKTVIMKNNTDTVID